MKLPVTTTSLDGCTWGWLIDIKVNHDVILSLIQKGQTDNPFQVLPPWWYSLTQADSSHCLPTVLARALLSRYPSMNSHFISQVHVEKSDELTLKWVPTDCQNALGNSLPSAQPASLRVNPPVYQQAPHLIWPYKNPKHSDSKSQLKKKRLKSST